MNWLQKSVSSIRDWLVVGSSPKVRDPQNAERRGGSVAGVCVNDRTAMGVSAFFACVRLIASTIGSLPLPVYRRGRDGAAKLATDSALYKVLYESPNADQTPVDYLEFMAISLMMRGNHYARKLKEGTRLIGLEPVRPDIVTVRRRANGSIRYRWSADGQSWDLGEDDVFHVRGFGGGPLSGLSVVSHARETLGIAIAADQAAAAMFANGVQSTGALVLKEFLDEDQRKIARGDMTDQFTGAQNAGKPFILEGGAEWKQISVNPDDAQLLESRGWSVEEICRWFGVPPVMIGHTEKQTSFGSGVEQLMLWFVKSTLNAYLRRIEKAISKQLISPAERVAGLYAEFNLEGLLRGDSAGRSSFYRTMTQIGVMTVNECRAKENLPPIEGGDVARVQAQNVPLEDSLREAFTAAANQN